MKDQLEDELVVALTHILSDGFNRSINALEDAGALDLREMRTAYQGVGSTYYDVVTSGVRHGRSRERRSFNLPEGERTISFCST